MKKLIAILLLLAAVSADASTGVVRRIVIQAATTDELDETVLEPGLLIYRVDDAKDVRIGDGMTAGGIRLWNFLALTNPPSVYDRDLNMDGHGIVLNDHYTLKAEGGYLSIYHVGTNPVFRLVGSEAAGHLDILGWENNGTNVVLTVQHVEGDAPPVLEASESLVDPIWTSVVYELERLSSVTVTLTFPQPETGVFTYYRVSTSVSDPMANFLVPLLVDGEPVLTAETDPAWTAASDSVVYATTLGYTAAVEQAASAYGWGDHAEAGYLTEEADAAALSAVAAVSDRLGVVESWGDHAEGSIYPPTATNFFIRPDGGTNTITFDADGTMIVSVDGAAALTVRTNGNLGVKNGGSGTYAIYATGDIFATARMRALDFRASDAGSYFLDPNGESMLASATFDGTLTVTQGVTRIIPPTSTNGLVSGTLWNDGGVLKIMP